MTTIEEVLAPMAGAIAALTALVNAKFCGLPGVRIRGTNALTEEGKETTPVAAWGTVLCEVEQ